HQTQTAGPRHHRNQPARPCGCHRQLRTERRRPPAAAMKGCAAWVLAPVIGMGCWLKGVRASLLVSHGLGVGWPELDLWLVSHRPYHSEGGRAGRVAPFDWGFSSTRNPMTAPDRLLVPVRPCARAKF